MQSWLDKQNSFGFEENKPEIIDTENSNGEGKSN
jgi:hypothetical protein